MRSEIPGVGNAPPDPRHQGAAMRRVTWLRPVGRLATGACATPSSLARFAWQPRSAPSPRIAVYSQSCSFQWLRARQAATDATGAVATTRPSASRAVSTPKARAKSPRRFAGRSYR